MKERPILFSGPMVCAILEGRKSQTRRVLKHQPRHEPFIYDPVGCTVRGCAGVRHCPYGVIGDRLRVKEHTWLWCERRPNGKTKRGNPKWHYVPLEAAPHFYVADHPERPNLSVASPRTGNWWGWRKKVSRFMPNWASRITLEIVGVRVERVQGISEEDAKAEGVQVPEVNVQQPQGSPFKVGDLLGSYRDHYRVLWGIINGVDSWATNPWVWVITFKRVKV